MEIINPTMDNQALGKKSRRNKHWGRRYFQRENMREKEYVRMWMNDMEEIREWTGPVSCLSAATDRQTQLLDKNTPGTTQRVSKGGEWVGVGQIKLFEKH